MNLKNCTSPLALGVILGVVGVIAAGVLAYMQGVTAGPIEKAREQKTIESLACVLPDGVKAGGTKLDFDGVTFYPAFDAGGKLTAFAAAGSSKKGYAGKIEGLVGLSLDGKVLEVEGGRSGVLITSQNETPGLGAEVCNRTAVKTLAGVLRGDAQPEGMPANAVLDSLKGADSSEIKVKKDGGEIEFRTGATITSRAVTDMVAGVLKAYNDNRVKLLEAAK